MKKCIIFLLLLPIITTAQEIKVLSLSKANEMAKQNYPVIKQRELLKQTKDISIENLSKGFLPQFNLSAQASYQSDVTQIKIPIPGISFSPLSKDQYKVLADVNQLLYDGGMIKDQKDIQRLKETADQQNVEVQLYSLKDRINQLYLGVLLLDEQAKQVDLVKGDLNTGFKNTEALVKNGVSFKSNLDLMKAELANADQRLIELKASRKGLLDVLSLFINANLPEEVQFEKPESAVAVLDNVIQRPELKWYSSQQLLLNGQNSLIDSRNRPMASVFLQGGYGRPGLNFLNNDFAFFYVTGLRLNWAFGGLYTQKREKELIEINKKSIEIQQETFLLNTNTSLKQQAAEMNKLSQLIAKDNEIIALRVSVKNAASAQLENGVITVNDYLKEVNAEDQARQNLILHQVQMMQAQINYQTISGK